MHAMLTIRDMQMTLMQLDGDRRLQRLLGEKMAAAWPEPCAALPESQLSALCARAIADCRKLNIRTDQCIARLLNWRFALGHQFPQGDWEAEVILGATDVDETRRMDTLVARLIERRNADAADN